MSSALCPVVAACCLLSAATVLPGVESVRAGDTKDTVATAVYSRIGNGYKRAKARDGSYKPEYYALSNGGRIYGTASDLTVDRVTYAEVAEVAKRVLAVQNYHYAQSKEQAKLLLVLNWGSTIAPNGMHQQQNVASLRDALASLNQSQYRLNNPEPWESNAARPVYPGQDLAKNATSGLNRSVPWATNEEMAVVNRADSTESSFAQSMADDRIRDQLNTNNARVLGYMDDLADANDIRRYAGGGDRYADLIADVEECRYYIVISAYDFKQLVDHEKKKLLWQTRVSVRAPGNSFNETYLAMLKSASKYFGQNSGRLVRGEEGKGLVELGELKYLGEAKPPAEPADEPADDSADEPANDAEEKEE